MKRDSGFTLLELILVVTLLAILAVAGLPKIYDIVVSAKQGVKDNTIGSIQSALQIYASQEVAAGRWESYPPILDNAPNNSEASASEPFFSVLLENGINQLWYKWSPTCYSFTGKINDSEEPQVFYQYNPATGSFIGVDACS